MSGSVYGMIGKDPEAMVQKAGLVLTMHKAMETQGLTPSAAASRFGISLEQLTLVLGGRFRDVPAEHLLAWLRELGFSVDVTLHPPMGQARKAGRLAITPLPHQD